MTDSIENHVRLSASGEALPGGQFEILAITAGVGNGWEFPAEALQRSLSLWDGVECFIDHSYGGHSLRDLAGVVYAPEWDGQSQGVRARLKAVGPSAGLLQELGKQMLAEGGVKKPRVGFSADVLFTAQGRTVEQVLRVFSVDLVFDPARGGMFQRALNAIQPDSIGDHFMTDVRSTEAVSETAAPADRPADAAAQVQAETRVQLSGYLLDTALAASKLPAAMQERLRAQFTGRSFAAPELQAAIDDARQLVSDLTAGQVVQGPRSAGLSGMFSSEDQLQAAVDDLFGIPRSQTLAGLQVARLSGIRELYLMLTGDDDLHGSYHPGRVRLATTADFTGLVKNALNKIVANTWEQLGRAGYDWWSKIACIEHFTSLQSITGTLVGTVGSLPVVDEGAAYTELEVGDSPETASFTKYGGYIPLTLELIDRDETRKLKAYPRELAAAGLRNISAQVAGIFTAGGGVGPQMADEGDLFNADPVALPGGHANLGTAALDGTAWEAACQAVYDQPMLVKNAAGLYGSGPKMAINPRYLLAPRALQLAAMQILYPTLERATGIVSQNLQQGQPGDVITVPEWTDAANWAAACDPAIAPAVFVGERFGLMPEIFIAGDNLSPAVFSNDEHRLKVRHFLAVWVNDFRPLYKSNVGE
jgi:hypothetical protein